MPVLRTTLRRAVEPVGSPATFFLVLLLLLSVAVPAGAQHMGSGVASADDSASASTPSVETAFALLRERDQILERVARQMAHPNGVTVDADGLEQLAESVQRLELWIAPLVEQHPELLRKHAALVHRARELVAASSRSRLQNADLVTFEESVRWLQVADEAFVTAGVTSSELSQSACDTASTLGVGTRGIQGLDGDREALLRFVAPTDGRFLVDTNGSSTDTRLVVTDECHGTELARGDDESSLRAQVQFSAKEGDAVWIRVGADREGFVRLAVERLSTQGGGTASITGNVSARVGGQPIESLPLRAENPLGGVYYSSTDASGNYQFTNLPADTYEVYSYAFDYIWVNQIWDGINCGIDFYACEGVDGDPIVVADGQTVEDIDFALGRPGVITGKVTDTVSGEPIPDAEVRLYTGTNTYSYTATDGAGRYRFIRVEPGTYFLRAEASSYHSELFDGIDCSSGCDVTTGTPVAVATDGAVSGVDFDLDLVGGVFGEVTAVAGGSPNFDGYVEIYDDEGTLVNDSFIQYDGSFFVPIADPGLYFARTRFLYYSYWVDQVWQGVDCVDGCDLGLATPIVLGENEAVEISFEVLALGSLSGSLSAVDAGAPAQFGTEVTLYDESGNFVNRTYTGIPGGYFFEALSSGDYLVTADNSEFRAEIYDDVPCSVGNVCNPLLGTPVSVALDATTENVDFAFDRLGIIRGTVTRAGGGATLEDVAVFAVSASGAQSGGGKTTGVQGGAANTDEHGEFRIAGLESGSYHLYTISSRYLDEAYDDLPCEDSCNLGLADEVVVPGIASVVSGIDFGLQREAWIQGSISVAGVGNPVNATVRLFQSDGTEVMTTYSGSDGEYLFSALADGAYYVVADPYGDSLIGEVYEDVPCGYVYQPETCDLMAGTLVPVSVDNGAEVNFELDIGGVIAGTVKDQFGNSIYDGYAYALDPMGNIVGSDFIYSSYEIEGLPTGDYHVVTFGTDHQDELWPNTPCLGDPVPNCNLADGTAVSVGPGTTAMGVDFVLSDLATISVDVIDSVTGDTVPSAVRLYDEMGTWVGSDSGSDIQLVEIPPGTYYLRTSSAQNHINGVYGGELCDPGCDPTTGTPIVVGIGDVISGIEIPLPMGPGIKGRVFDGPTGDPLPGVSIDLWDSEGDHRAGAVTDSEGWFRLPYQAGTYFISTYNDDGLEDFLFDGIPCPDGSAWEGLCDPTLGTPFVIEEYTPLQRLDLPFGDPTIFGDGFESGDTSAWSAVVGGG